MSKAEQNRQLIMDYFAAWSAGDVEKGESYYSHDFVSYQAGHSALAGVFHGKQELHDRWIAPLLEMTGNRWYVSGEPEIILAGDDGIVVIVHETMERDGKGKISTDKLVVYTIRDDKITTCRMYDGDQGAIDDFWS
ncbi:nuclear transport factor 2 family protein [Sphingobium cupriresistens]|uniref:nuclear transport factor 2 family protein n=1 Tax=Sphingobium cupriresistens TaxID=1132417 RepID=UPI000835963E|nr:nuclear transport factor 2 family protein [Sphingobium cupriresistens]